MKDIFLIARTHLYTAIRERITLFWFLVFPVFLFVILTLIFGRLGQEGEMSFAITLVNMDVEATETGEYAAVVNGLFESVGLAQGEEPLFTVDRPPEGANLEMYLEQAKQEVRRGKRAAIVFVPEGFSSSLNEQVARSSPEDQEEHDLVVYYSQGNATSEIAVGIIDHILAEVEREVLSIGGLFDDDLAVPSGTAWAGSDDSETLYVDFLLPGIILMGFFTAGLFGIPGSILFARDRRILRRYWVTPLNVPRFLSGVSLGHLALCLMQFLLLFIIGRYAFGATISFLGVKPILVMILAVGTFLSFGFLISAIVKTANAGMAVANILNTPMIFLSGLFFPVTGLPAFIMAIVYVNPVSYLADAMRASVGVESGLFPIYLVVGVPLVWIAFSVVVASWRLRMDVER